MLETLAGVAAAADTTAACQTVKLLVLSLTQKAPHTTGAFYFFNHSQTTKKHFQYLAPSPTSTAKLQPLFTPLPISTISTSSKAAPRYSSSLPIYLSTQRIYQILRSLSPSRMPLACLNLTAA